MSAHVGVYEKVRVNKCVLEWVLAFVCAGMSVCGVSLCVGHESNLQSRVFSYNFFE